MRDVDINFYWIFSIMKIYIICLVPTQIPYLGKSLFVRYRPKCSQPIRLQDFLINHISRTNQWNSLIFCMCKFTKIKRWSKLFWHGQKSMWPISSLALKLNIFLEWTDGINWFFTYRYKFTQIKYWKILWGGHSQNWLWPVWSRFFISKINRWYKLIFCILVKIQEG